ncbi:MAG TPA: hypothetical protein VNY24_00550 [Candidatus Acidoferrales bacterium]|nr:hypothetical protein [Candidatus Acidoferrales bacterium]
MDRQKQDKSSPAVDASVGAAMHAPSGFRTYLEGNAQAHAALLKLALAGVPDGDLVDLLYDASLILKWRRELETKHLSFEEALGLPDARSVDRLVKKLRDLAAELDGAEEALAKAGLTVRWDEPWGSGYFESWSSCQVSTAQVLRAQAVFLESAKRSIQGQPTTSVAQHVEDRLVEFIRQSSGGPHYAEAATLLIWLYNLPGCGSFKTTEEALSRRAQRHRPDANS